VRRRILLLLTSFILALAVSNRCAAEEIPQLKMVEMGLGITPSEDAGNGGFFTAGYVAPVTYPLSLAGSFNSFHFEGSSYEGVSVGPRVAFGEHRHAPAGGYVELAGVLYKGNANSESFTVPGFQGAVGVIGPSIGVVALEFGAMYAITAAHSIHIDLVPPGTVYTGPYESRLQEGALFLRAAILIPPKSPDAGVASRPDPRLAGRHAVW
jgi:hypothetical protein